MSIDIHFHVGGGTCSLFAVGQLLNSYYVYSVLCNVSSLGRCWWTNIGTKNRLTATVTVCIANTLWSPKCSQESKHGTCGLHVRELGEECTRKLSTCLATGSRGYDATFDVYARHDHVAVDIIYAPYGGAQWGSWYICRLDVDDMLFRQDNTRSVSPGSD